MASSPPTRKHRSWPIWPGIYRTRLAALDKVNNAMESALRTAPHDPVINQYYLATMGARVATQQMAARPVGLALRGF